jgi:riboflavin synthase
MFTGIITTVGKVIAKSPTESAIRFTLEAPDLVSGLGLGDSVSCEGVCLTVESLNPSGFTVCAVQETLEKTALSRWDLGTSVNLEPALKAGTPLGGHFVLGHVDGVATSVAFEPHPEGGGEWWVELPGDLIHYCVSKGSISLAGTSLTIAEIQGHRIRIALIPHTLSHTTLGLKKPGHPVHVEVDILAKHIERMMQAWQVRDTEAGPSPKKSKVTFSSLAEWGFAPAGQAAETSAKASP